MVAFAGDQQGSASAWDRRRARGILVAFEPAHCVLQAGFLKRVSIEGDVVAPICPTTTQMSAGSWGADNTIVLSDNTVGALMRVPAGGGNPESALEGRAGGPMAASSA